MTKLEVLKILQRRLNGKCIPSYRYCPESISGSLWTHYGIQKWCRWCSINFNWLDKKNILTMDSDCPCKMKTSEGEIILHLDQIIEEMERRELWEKSYGSEENVKTLKRS